IVYCQSGVRSLQASNILVANNFSKIFNMEDGITAWITAEYDYWIKLKADPVRTDISVHVANDMINNNTGYPNLLVLDVRTLGEFATDHLFDAILIPLAELEGRLNELASYNDTEIIVYCQSGARSLQASDTLVANNFSKIFNMVARRKEKLDTLGKALQEKYSVKVDKLVADLSNISDNEKVISKINELDNLDVLINNAGFGVMKSFTQIEIETHIAMINVHFTSPVMLCHAAIPKMQKRKRGVIINTSSMSAISKDSSLIMYTTTKSAVTIFSELLKVKLKGTGIYIQALCPGLTYSEFHDTETMGGFQRSWYEPERWMKAEEVVSLSLKAIKSKDVIFIPGEINRAAGRKIRKLK
ncbi:unnamed protein product, partial [marine sediment metagenome]